MYFPFFILHGWRKKIRYPAADDLFRVSLESHKDHFFVVTKCGRGLNPHVAEGYTPENMEAFIDGSLRRLGVEQLHLVLLHCPPTSVYHKDSLFAGMDKLVEKGKIAHYGVSIEKVDRKSTRLNSSHQL